MNSPINWTKVYFEADRNKEPFANVVILTLVAHAEDILYDEAFRDPTLEQDPVKIGLYVQKKLQQGLHLREFVRFEEDKIVVGLNADVIDDTHNERALNMITNSPEIKKNTLYEFGDLILIRRFLT